MRSSPRSAAQSSRRRRSRGSTRSPSSSARSCSSPRNVGAVRFRADDPVRARRVVAAFGARSSAERSSRSCSRSKVASGYIHAGRGVPAARSGAPRLAVVGLIAVVVVHRLRPGIGRWFNRQTGVLRSRSSSRARACSCGPTSWRPAPCASSRRRVPARHPARAAPCDQRVALHVVAALVLGVLRRGRDRRSRSWASCCSRRGVRCAATCGRGGGLPRRRSRRRHVHRAPEHPSRPTVGDAQVPAGRDPGIAIAVVFAIERGSALRALDRPDRRGARGRDRRGGRRRDCSRRSRPRTRRFRSSPHARSTARSRRSTTSATSPATTARCWSRAADFLNNELPDALRDVLRGPDCERERTSISDSTARQWHDARAPVPRRDRRARRGAGARRPGARSSVTIVVSDDADPERVYERAPRRFVPVPVEIWLIEIPPNAG